MRRIGAVLLAVAVLFAAAWTARDASAAPPDCAKCHADDAADAKARFPLREYGESVHAKQDCTLCHRRPEGSFEKVPHTRTEPDLTGCRACHGVNLKEFNKELTSGVHGELKCNECHDAHVMKRLREAGESPLRTQRANAGCIRCHAAADLTGEAKGHGWLPNRDRHAKLRCIVCHAPLGSERNHEIVVKAQGTRACDACHRSNSPVAAKYAGEDDRTGWITNPVLFEKAYVPGATRNRLADRIILGVFALTLVGALGHWLLRSLAAARRPAEPYDVEKTFLYAAGLRLWHWTNALLVVGLAVTGLRIHFGGRESPVLSFAGAFNFHTFAGVALVLLTIVFFVRNARTGDARQYLSKPEDGTAGILRQVGYYMSGAFRGVAHPYHATKDRRFNPLQQVTYASIMYGLVPLIAISGIVLLFPDQLPDRIAGRPAPWWFATAHYLLGCGLIAFLLGHLYLATTGDKASYNFKAMWDGFHRAHVKKPPGGGGTPK
jgi:thiosulfate reductase cytochrome b subunit